MSDWRNNPAKYKDWLEWAMSIRPAEKGNSMSTGPSLTTGVIPYEDGSGFEVDIKISPPGDFFKYTRVELNADNEFTHFDIEDWPLVRAAIDRAVHAYNQIK